MEQSSGWIAPNGKFYPCESYGHMDSAAAIYSEYYPPVVGVRCVWLDEDELEYQLDDPPPDSVEYALVAILETADFV